MYNEVCLLDLGNVKSLTSSRIHFVFNFRSPITIAILIDREEENTGLKHIWSRKHVIILGLSRCKLPIFAELTKNLVKQLAGLAAVRDRRVKRLMINIPVYAFWAFKLIVKFDVWHPSPYKCCTWP